jgi:hypothetical protein
MNDAQFLAALERQTLAAGEFGHRGHVRAAYLYLTRERFVPALVRTRQAILEFAASHGQVGRYHETMTLASVSLIAERLYQGGDRGSFEAFERAYPELFGVGLLESLYPSQFLHSDLARNVFVLPRGVTDCASSAGRPL